MTMTKTEGVLKISRHAIHLTDDLHGPQKLYSYVLRATYNEQCGRMRHLIGEANASQDRLKSVVEAFRQLMGVNEFRVLLQAESLACIPRTLAERVPDAQQNIPLAAEKPGCFPAATQQLVGGIWPEALEMLEDCPVPPRVFGLLRQVLPPRQVEIAGLMLALDKVKLNWARVLIALTPQSQLVDPSVPRTQFANLTDDHIAAMEIELAALSQEFLGIFEHLGWWGLELVAVRGYMTRLMDNARVLRYLARCFPDILSQFQKMSEPTR